MKVFIPPAIRRIMEAYPPVEPLAVSPPQPPDPPPTIDLWRILLQVTAVFFMAWIILKISQLSLGFSFSLANLLKNVAVIILVFGLLLVTIRTLFILRRQIRPNQRQENEYFQALAIYAQAEKNYYDRIAQEHTPQKVKDYRQQELATLRGKLPSFDFEVSGKNAKSLPPSFNYFQEKGYIFYQPVVNIPGIAQQYIPEFILQNENKTVTIVVELENNNLDQSLIREFCQQRGVIFIVVTEAELISEELESELNHLCQKIGI